MIKPEFTAYLDQIEMPTDIKTRVKELFELHEVIFIDEIQEIFIEEYITAEGNREFKSLHFFSDNLDYEIANFLLADKIFIIPIKNNVDDVRIVERTYYNFIHATDYSKFVIQITVSGGNSVLNLYATKENCNQLTKILKKYFLSNFFL